LPFVCDLKKKGVYTKYNCPKRVFHLDICVLHLIAKAFSRKKEFARILASTGRIFCNGVFLLLKYSAH
jgi:hypothetical protein